MKKIIVLAALFCSLSVIAQDKPKCLATTKAGTQCKHNAAPSSQYCKQHDPATPKCGAPTKSGAPCKVSVKNVGDKCHNHKG